MQNRNSEELFALIKGMNRWEKKSFHLFAKRNSGSNNLKVLKLYNAINSMDVYNEKELIRKAKNIHLKQLPGMKSFLYNLLLDSLRISRKEESIDLRLHKLMEHAKILYDRGLPVPAMKTLKKLKALALLYHQVSFAFQSVVTEKKIELVYGNCDPKTIQLLNMEMEEYNRQLSMTGILSNASMLLYGWYKLYGCVRNKEDLQTIHEYYQPCLAVNPNSLSFYPKLYLLQARTYYYLAGKEDQLFYEAACDWKELFRLHPEMKEVETIQYRRAIIYLSEAALLLNNTSILHHCAVELKKPGDEFYSLVAHLNLCLANNEYDKDLLHATLKATGSIKNVERQVVLCYKAALLCYNNRKFENAIDFSHPAINITTNASVDLQHRLRLIHSEAHKQIGNEELSASLRTSVKRFEKCNAL